MLSTFWAEVKRAQSWERDDTIRVQAKQNDQEQKRWHNENKGQWTAACVVVVVISFRFFFCFLRSYSQFWSTKFFCFLCVLLSIHLRTFLYKLLVYGVCVKNEMKSVVYGRRRRLPLLLLLFSLLILIFFFLKSKNLCAIQSDINSCKSSILSETKFFVIIFEMSQRHIKW